MMINYRIVQKLVNEYLKKHQDDEPNRAYEKEYSGMRARMLSDLTKKLADERRKNDMNEVTVNELRKIVLYLLTKIDMAVVLTDEELEKISGKYNLKLYPNIHNEMVIKAERKRNPQGNADSDSVTSEATI